MREVWSKIKNKKKIALLTSAATHGFHVLVWLATTDDVFEQTIILTHTHNVSTQRMFLAEADTKIRHLSEAKDTFDFILLIFGIRARVNHSAAWLAFAEKPPWPQPSSSHYDNMTPHHHRVKGHIDLQLQQRVWESRHQQEHSRNQDFKHLKEEKRNSCVFYVSCVRWCRKPQSFRKLIETLISSVEEINTDFNLF